MTNAACAAALSILVGVLCGMLYDGIRVVRLLLHADVRDPLCKTGVYRWFAYAIVFCGDLLFFVASAALLCVFFFLTGDGRARWYGIAGAAFGFFCYYQTFGRLVIAAFEGMLSLCGRLARRLLRACARAPLALALQRRYIIYVEKKKTARAARRRRRQIQKRKSCCKN